MGATRQESAKEPHVIRADDYKRMYEKSALAIFRSAPDGRYLMANPAGVRLHGYSSEAELLKAVGNVSTEVYVHAGDRKTMLRLLEERGSIEGFECEIYRHKTKERIWVRQNLFRIMDEEGRLLYQEGYVEDISERKRAMEALRESEARLIQATQLAGLGHWIWDAVEDRCLYCSEENARIHGLSVEDYMNKASTIKGEFAMIHPDDRRNMKSVFQALRNGQGFEEEYRLLTPAGDVRYIREVAKPVFGEAERVVQEIGTIQDITEQKQLEAQLRQAQKMEAIGQLTGGVAHDFNNLLAIIMGNAELLSREQCDENPRLEAVLRAARRGANLVQQLLAFSRRQPLKSRVLDLNMLVRDMREILSRSLGETIEVKTDLAEGLWHAFADPAQVEAALLNLAINALDAMPDGGTLTLETENAEFGQADGGAQPEVTPGDYVVLAVTDNGVGMAPNELEHAFEPFFTTKEVGQGTGLGLSMVYGFAKQSGGHAVIHSAQGQGTTVKLYLPRTEGQAETPGQVEEETPRGQGETVFVVEDDADVRQFAEHLLEALDYRVFTAKDGRTALAILEHIPRPDLLLSDVVLPGGLSGPDLAKQVLKLYPGLKIIFMSGYPANAAKDKDFVESGEALLSKPFSQLQLARALRKALD